MKNENTQYIYTGLHFIGQEELFNRLAIGRTTFEQLTDPKHENYDPDFPKPSNLFTGRKYRYSSLDVDAYVRSKSHTKAA